VRISLVCNGFLYIKVFHFLAVLGIELRALHLLGRHTNQFRPSNSPKISPSLTGKLDCLMWLLFEVKIVPPDSSPLETKPQNLAMERWKWTKQIFIYPVAWITTKSTTNWGQVWKLETIREHRIGICCK
jgi:hypothetical protein